MKLRRWRQEKRQESSRFNEQNNNSARFFVYFFAVPAQLRREMTNFKFTWERERQGDKF